MLYLKKLKIVLQYNYIYYLILFFSLLYVFLYISFIKPNSIYLVNTNKVTGYIIDKKINDEKISLVIKAKEKILVNYYFKKNEKINDLKYGDYVTVYGTSITLKNNTNFNMFNYKKYLYSKKIFYIMECNKIVKIKNNTNIIYIIKNNIISRINKCKKTKDYINVIVASKHPSMQWLDMESAKEHCEKGIGIWKFASDDDPDIVLACAGDTPTVEVLAATTILRKYVPQIKIRVVNVVDLMKLESNKKHPHGLTDEEYNSLFTVDKPIIFNFHGYPSLIHQLVYNRENKNIHVHGYNEEGTITTPFDMRVQNKIDRFNLVIDALKYLDNIPNKDEIIFMCNSMLEKHNKYIAENGVDMDEVNDWKWT